MQKPERKFTKPSSISQALKCTICCQVYNNPTRLFCSHTFCKNCIEQWNKSKNQCPVCRIPIDKKNIGTDRIAQNIINSLQVLCPTQDCTWKGPNSQLNIHFTYNCSMRFNKQNKINIKKKKGQAKILQMPVDQDLQQKINMNTMKGSLQARLQEKLLKTTKNESNTIINKSFEQLPIKKTQTFDFLQTLFD